MYNAMQNFSREALPETEAGILGFLESVGRISDNNSFDEKLFLDLATHGSEKIRTLAVKNLAKLEKKDFLNFYMRVVKNDSSTTVQREAVSAIGRMRNRKAIPHLLRILNSNDPKVTMQAIRSGLNYAHLAVLRDLKKYLPL